MQSYENTTVTMYREITDRQLHGSDEHDGDLDSFKASWLQATPVQTPAVIQQKNDDYFLPESVPVEEARDYALTLVYTLLEDNRPPSLPPHNGSVFLFGSTEHTMNRQYRLELSIPFTEYKMIGASWDAAKALFMDTMDDFEIMHATTASQLQDRVEAYWDSAFIVLEPSDIEHGYEYYTPSPINPDYIESISDNKNV